MSGQRNIKRIEEIMKKEFEKILKENRKHSAAKLAYVIVLFSNMLKT